jgi:hypothetical protein
MSIPNTRRAMRSAAISITEYCQEVARRLVAARSLFLGFAKGIGRNHVDEECKIRLYDGKM